MTVNANTPEVLRGCRTTRIYCLPDCPAGKRTKDENRVYFQSAEEARACGYRACKVCKPGASDIVPEIFFTGYYQSPLGKYLLVSSEKGLVCLTPEERAARRLARWHQAGIKFQDGNGHNHQAARALEEYFAGRRHEFIVPLDLRGTDFQHRVWRILGGIPYGKTRSYGEVASALGSPAASRAVGGAVGSNPVSIIVPCHRVIGADGGLTGYGGGLVRKQALLNLETGLR